MLNLHHDPHKRSGGGSLLPNWSWRFGAAGRLAQGRLLCLVVLTAIGCERAIPKPQQEHILKKATGSIAFSPDGERLLTCSQTDRGMVNVWDPRTGQELSAFSGPEVTYPLRWDRLGRFATDRLSLGGFVLSPKGTLAASVEIDHQVPPPPLPISPKEVEIRLREGCVLLLWDTVTGKVVRSVPVGLMVGGPAFSPDGKLVALSDALERVRLIDVETGKVLPSPQFPPLSADRPLYQLAFSPDGKRLACGREGRGKGAAVSVWDLASGERIWESQNIEHRPLSLAYSPDGSLLAACDGSKNIHVWDATDGQHPFTLGGQVEHEHKIAFHPNGRYLASTGGTATRIWDLQAKKVIHTLDHAPRHGDDIAYSPDGKWLATACPPNLATPEHVEGSYVIVWNLQPAEGSK